MTPLQARVILLAAAVATQLTAACTTSAPAKGPAAAGTPAAPASPGTAPATPRPGRVAERPKVPSGMTVGYAVFDRRTGRTTLDHDVHHRFRSASVVKILIALDYLERTTAVPPGDRGLLRSMLRSSDDRAATRLWTRGGQRKIVQRMTAKLRLTDTAPPPAGRPGFWGYTAISAGDMVRTYRYVLDKAPQRVRDSILGDLAGATRCGLDGFDQYFGIPRAIPRPWAIKQGWSGYGSIPPQRCTRTQTTGRTGTGTFPTGRVPTGGEGDGLLQVRPAGFAPDLGLGRPVLHTTGTVGAGHRWIVVVLSLNPAGGSFQTSTGRLTSLTRAVYRAGTRG